MKKYLLFPIFGLIGVFLIITLSSQKVPQRKFYYAFDQKIYIDPIANKYVLLFENKSKTDNAISRLAALINRQRIKKQNETTITVELTANQQIEQLIVTIKNDIVIQKPVYKAERQELYYTDEIIFEPKKGVKKEDILRAAGLTISAVKEEKQFFTILKIPSTLDACDIANKIQESGLVKFCHPNFIMPLEAHQVIPNDTYFNNQYYLRNIGQVFNPAENHAGIAGADIRASWAWTMTTGNNAIIVAVLDQGVTANHPDLPNARQVRLNGSNFIIGENANDPTPNGNDNHGNACAGIIAATQNNNEGISGIAPNVRIMPIKILGGNIDNARIANAIDFAWQNGAHILSNSWGTGFTNPNAIPVIVQAIQRATTQGRNGLGCVVAFSASNSASHAVGRNGQVRFPSNVQINGVLTVGASNRFDQQADYSPTSNAASPENQIIDIVAPSHNAYPPEIYAFNGDFGGIAGETFEVWTIDIPGNVGYNVWTTPGYGNFPAVGEILPNFGPNNLAYSGRMGGTSSSCPEVAGAAALMLSVNPNLTQQQVFNILTQTADRVGGYVYTNGRSAEMGHGRLDACEAVTQALTQVRATSAQTSCSTGTISVPNIAADIIYHWQVSGDLLIDGISATKTTTDNFIDFTGTNGTAYVIATTNCGTLQWWAGFTPHQREIQGLYPEYTSGDHVSVLVNTTPYDTYYRWYINNTLVKEGSFAFSYCTCFYETPDARVCGDNTIRVEVETSCGITSSFDAGFFRICGYYRTQSNVELFPNPARDQVTLRLKQVNAKQSTDQLKDIREVRILDKVGNVKKIVNYPANTNNINVNISNLPLDIYYVEITDGRNSARLPLSIVK